MAAWTTPADIRDRVRRRWDDGSMLRALAADEPFPVIDLRLRRPGPGEIGADLDAVRRWAAALEAGAQRRGHRCYHLRYADVGGRVVGRNRVPDRAQVTGYDEAWELLGVGDEVAAYERILGLTGGAAAVRAWVGEHPLHALRVGDDWAAVVAAYRWLLESRGSGRYLRQVDVPGVDTKFVERHRPLLAQLLGVPAPRAGFLHALGLAAKPESVRLRFSRCAVAGLPSLTEATLRVDELAEAHVSIRTAVIVENEITYLSLPVPAHGVVLWGKGFEVDRAGSLPWLREAEVHYWGDLDTHGFAILHQLRAWLPQTRSFLMDRDTLLAHRERWGSEGTPTAARLDRLTDEESALYGDLVSDRFGEGVRLEQERIAWDWARHRLPAACRITL